MRESNKNIKDAVVILLALCVAGLIIVGFSIAFKQHEERVQKTYFDPDVIEKHPDIFKKSIEQSDHVYKAMDLEEAGKFDLAIKEYKEALETQKGGSEGMARYGLSVCYEKTGQYKLALEQINWLLERKVASTPELLERKQRIEKLLIK